jgi:hypothetical protein
MSDWLNRPNTTQRAQQTLRIDSVEMSLLQGREGRKTRSEAGGGASDKAVRTCSTDSVRLVTLGDKDEMRVEPGSNER